MEVMEEGNLMDRVRILIQRDLQYYEDKQTILQESLCPAVVGGKLDFPRNASFAAVKLVLWWEEEYIAAYRKGSGLMQGSTNSQDIDEVSGGCGGIVKSSDPEKFVSMVTKCADQLLEHLHVLSQEALDHADLTVLTGTLGAAALIKNCMWCYIQSSGGTPIISDSGTLQKSYKEYQEMDEALAERVLDLHCRLMSLYVLQDAESLDWENKQPFFESERGSFVIQMWWFYMQGTRDDLWNTVPPKIAQRIFSGMLNESLTILTVRYMQAKPSEARSPLLVVDISNLLLCVTQLLPAICNNAEELAGLSLNTQSKMLRDIHAKCHKLLMCFILRGAPLEVFHKVFKKGTDNVGILKSRLATPSPWLVLTSPELFPNNSHTVTKLEDLDANCALALELRVLLAQPQPNWPILLKIILMRDCKISALILQYTMKKVFETSNFNQMQPPTDETVTCGGFMCSGDGICKYPSVPANFFYDIVAAITHIVISTESEANIRQTILPSLENCGRSWAVCLDRQQVWNQTKPPWLKAILWSIKPYLPPIVTTLISAVQTGASMYQTMSLTIACFSQLWDCIPQYVTRIAKLLNEILPADVHPVANSVILQLLISALYTALYEKAHDENKSISSRIKLNSVQSSTSKGKSKSETKIDPTLVHKNSQISFDGTASDSQSISLALAEALCSIDKDNKHTEQIDEFLECVESEYNLYGQTPSGQSDLLEQTGHLAEVLASDILMTTEGKLSLKVLYHFIVHNSAWLFQQLGVSKNNTQLEPNQFSVKETPFLHAVFHIGTRQFDEFLTGKWKPAWTDLLQTPMGLSIDRVWMQISRRWEFNETDPSQLSEHDTAVVASLTSFLKTN